jgi:hypothetical protein
MTSAPGYHGEPRVGGTRNLRGKRGKRIVSRRKLKFLRAVF